MQRFNVSGMTCSHCVRAVTMAVEEADPGARVQVDLATGGVSVQGGSAPPGRIQQAIAEAGYTAEPVAA